MRTTQRQQGTVSSWDKWEFVHGNADAGSGRTIMRGEPGRWGGSLEVTEPDMSLQGKTPRRARDLSHGLRHTGGADSHWSRERRSMIGGHVSDQGAIDVTDAFQPRDHFLSNVTSFLIIDVCAIEACLRRQGLFVQLPRPTRDTALNSNRFEERIVKQRAIGGENWEKIGKD
jgi:hypothetical protein